MKIRRPAGDAFTLIELLVIIAIVGLMAALLIPAMGRAKEKARRATCSNNLRQINLGLRMYADGSEDSAPHTSDVKDPAFSLMGYKRLIKSYLGLNATSSQRDKVFACPSDTFYYDDITGIPRFVGQGLCEQPMSDHSSYAFNGANAMNNSSAPGISGRKLSSIIDPSRTPMVAEASAYVPWSWHQPKLPFTHQNAIFSEAMNMVSFVDGHVSYIRIYWDGVNRAGLALNYNPPAEYEYRWSGD
ncbi:MAG: hypothetical protein JWN25_633 [Verrucomicrobiales bacterium]|nr:hypothetical protein [Verrucomicrobiales bacterium]